jgi:hypothetical protein
MIAVSLLLAATLAPALPTRIYQCRDAGGAIGYQDRPCESPRGEARLEGGEQALRRWLEEQRQAEAAKRPASTPGSPQRQPGTAAPASSSQEPTVAATGSRGVSPRAPALASAGEERRLAVCSERFLHCARGGERAMDACIAALPRCGSGVGACCPAPCLERYRNSRARGETPSAAVYGALLDPDGASCAAAP